eukprot:Platyproteum_vivax@DN16564_c0_g1_i1.p1
MAAYSIVCHILSIRDRHNGNILLDSEGHVIHVDFGFMMTNSPGNVSFEANSFKLTHDFIEVMGGAKSRTFSTFRKLVAEGFLALRRESAHLIGLVDMMMLGEDNMRLPCFKRGKEEVAERLKEKFKLDMTELQYKDHN